MRRLQAGEKIPASQPRVYTTRDGYKLWRWHGEGVEVLEHRVFGRWVTKAEVVHHHDHDRQHNHDENLSELTKAEHSRLHHPPKIDRAEAARLYLTGMTTTAVAFALGTHAGNVSRMLAEMGVKARSDAFVKRHEIEARAAEIEAMARAKTPWDAIAREMGCTRGPIERICRRAGIPPLPAGNPVLRARGLLASVSPEPEPEIP